MLIHKILLPLCAAAFYTPFFKEVWDKKPEIEQAFNMEDPSGLDDSGEGTLERPPHHHHRSITLPPPRRSLPPRSQSAEGWVECVTFGLLFLGETDHLKLSYCYYFFFIVFLPIIRLIFRVVIGAVQRSTRPCQQMFL